ncbi:MAG TPA: ATPase, T2SS/T4P/T4SS family, partial [Candidatus Babeliales bacterium]|nr:ATPase, T2SS/T4P/T4SS family [Candidatus Babeliales bacterium]
MFVVPHDQSVISQVNSLIHTALSHGASDIHLEPTAEYLRVRYRIDGVLYDQNQIAHSIMQQVVSRLKVLGQMNIAEKRLPQDGKFSLTIDSKPVDFRVSTFPSL